MRRSIYILVCLCSVIEDAAVLPKDGKDALIALVHRVGLLIFNTTQLGNSFGILCKL